MDSVKTLREKLAQAEEQGNPDIIATLKKLLQKAIEHEAKLQGEQAHLFDRLQEKALVLFDHGEAITKHRSPDWSQDAYEWMSWLSRALMVEAESIGDTELCNLAKNIHGYVKEKSDSWVKKVLYGKSMTSWRPLDTTFAYVVAESPCYLYIQFLPTKRTYEEGSKSYRGTAIPDLTRVEEYKAKRRSELTRARKHFGGDGSISSVTAHPYYFTRWDGQPGAFDHMD